jgi:hypothetical protein
MSIAGHPDLQVLIGQMLATTILGLDFFANLTAEEIKTRLCRVFRFLVGAIP